MAQTDVVELPATLTVFGSPPTPATATVLNQSLGQRLARTGAALGACWGLALAGLFIPVAHFILVPTFVVAGIVAAVLRAREDRRLLEVCGRCPRCGAEQQFKIGGRFAPERSFDCPRCHSNLVMHASAEGPAGP
jgi:hypothetical protein